MQHAGQMVAQRQPQAPKHGHGSLSMSSLFTIQGAMTKRNQMINRIIDFIVRSR